MTPDFNVELSLVTVPTPEPGPDDVVVRMEASPLNPTDGFSMLAGAEGPSFEVGGGGGEPLTIGRVPPQLRAKLAFRIGPAVPVGQEGAGIVVGAGASSAAQALLGKTVAVWGAPTFTQFRTLPAADCLVLPNGTTPREAASCFVNPLTALGMVETMRADGHKALVHSAAASSLGRMLVRLCAAEGIEIVNVVRNEEHVTLLRQIGARHVCNSSAPDFAEQLSAAIAETGASLMFDAVGGGTLIDTVFSTMEAVFSRAKSTLNRYGSSVYKHAYVYGRLDAGPTLLHRRYGTEWGVSLWYLESFARKIGRDAEWALRERVAREVKTTFATGYSRVLSLSEAMSPEVIRAFLRLATGEKLLIDPRLGAG